MPVKIIMPSLSPTMKSGKLAKWLKNEGDKIKQGEVIAEIETDKAIMEVEASDEGILAKILIQAGTENVKVNTIIGIILLEEESQENLKNEILLQEDIEKPLLKNENTNLSQNSIIASPISKKLAIENNIDLSTIKGSGPGQRIIKTDILSKIEELQENKIPNSRNDEYTVIPNTTMRKVIAERLTKAKMNIPHFYLSLDCRLDNLLQLREKINANNMANKISINDFILKATGLTLAAVPELNSSWSNNEIIRYNHVDIAIAVGIPDGLITPIVKDVDKKPITLISKEVKELIIKARNNKLIPEEYQGGGFTISNLGVSGIQKFQAIINPPHSAILAIGSVNKQPTVVNDAIVITSIISMTISCDHRVIDGLIAAKWLSTLKKYLEEPLKILI